MLKPRDKSQPQKCGECGAPLPGGRSAIHCSSHFKNAPHHGRWRWSCPVCERNLGCDDCAGRFASDVLCDRCQVYADGSPAIELTAEERRLLIELVPHAVPERAIAPARLAFRLHADELHVKRIIYSLQQKGIAIDQIAGRYYLLPRAKPSSAAEVDSPVRVGIELLLPLGDRT